MTLNLNAEAFSGKFEEIGPGIWTLSSRHKPGGMKFMPDINNRVFAFKVVVNNEEELVFYGMPGQFMSDFKPATVAREFAESMGMKVFGILGQGGLHQAFIYEWAEEFPDTKIYIPPARVLRTAQGRKLIQRFGRERFSDLPGLGFPELKGQVEFRTIDGLLIHVDVPLANDGAKNSKWTMVNVMRNIKPIDPHDEVFCFHPATGLLIGGDNLTWHFKDGEKVPFLLKMNGCKCGRVDLVSAIVVDPVHRDKVAEHWKAILTNDVRAYCSFHELPGQAMEGPGVRDKLMKAVAKQMDPSPSAGCFGS